jgi:SAM-dependent methyltransferase
MSNFEAAKAFVEFGLALKLAGRRESASGPGSAVGAAAECLRLIDETVAGHGVTSILDLGCGDWNWMRMAAWRRSPAVRYEGWDAHAGLVESLAKEFGDERTRFRLEDASAGVFPVVDLVICRDVLFHLPLVLAQEMVRQVRRMRALFISTSFLGVGENGDIETYLPIAGWGFHRINLDIAPFGLAPCRTQTRLEAMCANRGFDRSVCLYDFRSGG